MLGKHGISASAKKLLHCAVLRTRLYTAYYLGFCVSFALQFIPLGDLFRVFLVDPERIACLIYKQHRKLVQRLLMR